MPLEGTLTSQIRAIWTTKETVTVIGYNPLNKIKIFTFLLESQWVKTERMKELKKKKTMLRQVGDSLVRDRKFSYPEPISP